MQYKTLAALLFASAAIAAPATETASASYSDYDDSFDDSDDSYGIGYDIPTSIAEVLETAVPAAWAMSLYTNSAFGNAEASRIADGDFPDWVSSLPGGAQTWVENELQSEASAYNSYLATETWDSSDASTTDASSTAMTGSSSSGSIATVTKTSSQTSSQTATETTTGSSSGTATPSGSASGSQTGSSSSTSTAGAPAATGGIAMSLAGAVGVLGLALAL